MNESLEKKIENILQSSDIVWPRYGSETIEELAEKIVQQIVVRIDEVELE